MGAHRYRAGWRSITFNRFLDDSGDVENSALWDQAYLNSDIRLESLDATPVQTQDYRELRQHLEGAEANEAFEGVRLLTLRGKILATTPADLEDKTWAMYEAFSPAACRLAFAANDPAGIGPFTFKRASAAGAKALQFLARPSIGRPVIIGRKGEGLSRPYVAQLVAMDPFAYDQTEAQTAVAVPAGGNVTNPGNIYSRPRIRITFSGAGHASLTLTNSTTGQAIVINATTAANGETWVIDTLRSTLTRASDGATRYDKLSSGFLTNLYLAAGANAIAIANATNVSALRVDHRGAYA